ncbi:DUF1343 domain-containing protein [Polaribacter sp. Z022]|uniref:exo-beta-N-acetylmuramidase NamZ family protein n=1 Tax=Polaribacter sp. Z022 TaxID=2927125 RepID=UPI002022646F|nr:DUF1343 domain-containing protein [Polaribacter sp. Z022]MCL7754284.1 DUF1343 domain-containing protein [Polaribacter sp. Z022]
MLNFQLISCAQNSKTSIKKVLKQELVIKTGAENTHLYLNLLKGKNIAIVCNQTSVIKNTHLVDSLLSLGVKVKKVFSPEHGFRGKADAAAHVADAVDTKTGLPILSLHGKSKKPSAKQLENIDVVIFDIQDVGVRFYTYISTLHYVMEACAENGIEVIVLDRPNPNGHYVDGPMLETKHASFVGKHPVPVVYGMTIGEYGQMINGEKWLKNGTQCKLTVIPLENYTHDSEYSLAIRPSPNLPNDKSINLYPSLGFFEGTIINAGRGTEFQFQRYGASFFPKSDFSYTPKANFGAKYPKQKGKLCYGVDLRATKKLSAINLEWLIDAYNKTPKTERFFGKTFTIHAGNTKLQKQIEQGLTAKEIRKTWSKDLKRFKKKREQYLIYE